MHVTLLKLPNALESAVSGVQDLLTMARFAAATRNRSLEATCEVLDVTAFLKRRTLAVGDVILLPPLLVPPQKLATLADTYGTLIRRLVRHHDAGVLIAACCTAVALPARSGALDGGVATTTWWAVPILQERFPVVHFQASAPLVEHEGFVTSAGPFSWIGQIIAMLERFHGSDLARLCAKYAVVEPGRPSNGIFVVPSPFDSDDPLVREVLDIIAEEASDRHFGANAGPAPERKRAHPAPPRKGKRPAKHQGN